MRWISLNMLNYFWKNGIKPIKEAVAAKLDTSRLANNMLVNQEGFALDARMGPVIQGDIDNLKNDVGEINSKLAIGDMKTLENNYVTTTYRKAGQLVELDFTSSNYMVMQARERYILGTLPEDCRPLKSFATMVAVGATPIMIYLAIASNGAVSIYPFSDIPTGSYMRQHIVFSVADA